MIVPIPYPGGKSKAIHILKKYLPEGTKSMASPFFGGGSFELYCANEYDIKVYGADIFEPLVNFWKVLKSKPHELMQECVLHIPKTQNDYNLLLSDLHDPNKSTVYRAACFYNAIRTSFSALIYSALVPSNIPTLTRAIQKIPSFDLRRITLSLSPFNKFIPKHRDKFMYVDPPYYIDADLYGNSNRTGKYLNHIDAFDHKLLHRLLSKHPSWMLSYNDCKYIRELYKGHKIKTVQLPYSIRKDRANPPSELLIFSKGTNAQ